MKMHETPTPYSIRKGCLHILLLIVVFLVIYVGAGMLSSADPRALGALFARLVLWVLLISLFVSYLFQKRHYWVAGIIALLMLGSFPALWFYSWYDTRISDAEKQLVMDGERIVSPAFGFSLPNPGKDFLLATELPEEYRKHMAAQPGLFGWVLENQNSPEFVIILVNKFHKSMDEKTFRSFYAGMQEVASESPNLIIRQEDTMIWEPAKREFQLSSKLENDYFYTIRCLPADIGQEKSIIVCASTLSEQANALDFVREGLAVGD